MASRLRESDEFSDAVVVGWESRNGEYHTVYDADGDKVGRAPANISLETAERTVIEYDGEYYTVGALTDDYTLDDAIDEILDQYGEG